MEIVLWIVIAGFSAFGMYRFITYIRLRALVPDHYEWLKVLSHSEWKNMPLMCEEMRKLKKTNLRLNSILIRDLPHLLRERLVEVDLVLTMRISEGNEDFEIDDVVFRLSSAGIRKKIEESKTTLTGFDSRLQPA